MHFPDEIFDNANTMNMIARPVAMQAIKVEINNDFIFQTFLIDVMGLLAADVLTLTSCNSCWSNLNFLPTSIVKINAFLKAMNDAGQVQMLTGNPIPDGQIPVLFVTKQALIDYANAIVETNGAIEVRVKDYLGT